MKVIINIYSVQFFNCFKQKVKSRSIYTILARNENIKYFDSDIRIKCTQHGLGSQDGQGKKKKKSEDIDLLCIFFFFFFFGKLEAVAKGKSFSLLGLQRFHLWN